jgi:hypothetical protein
VWITTRSGIKQRHLAAEGEFTSDLALHAARRALESAGIEAREVDAIVLATTTPDQTFPATATRVRFVLFIHCSSGSIPGSRAVPGSPRLDDDLDSRAVPWSADGRRVESVGRFSRVRCSTPDRRAAHDIRPART